MEARLAATHLFYPVSNPNHSGEYKCLHQLSAFHVYRICIRYSDIKIGIAEAKAALLECAPGKKDAKDLQIQTRWYSKRPVESGLFVLDPHLFQLAHTETQCWGCWGVEVLRVGKPSTDLLPLANHHPAHWMLTVAKRNRQFDATNSDKPFTNVNCIRIAKINWK